MKDSLHNPPRWHEVCPEFEQLFDASDISIRTLTEMDTGPKILIEDMYFDGADILHCEAGRFRFSFRDMESIDVRAGETVVIFPGHNVTIEAKAKNNRLVYGVFGGVNIDSYLTSCGLFDGAHGQAASQLGTFRELRRMVEAGEMNTLGGRRVCLGLLHDIIRTLKDELRRHGDTLMFDAIAGIYENLRHRSVRVDDLCTSLKTSRSHLNKVFRENGLCSPSEYIRRVQLGLAKTLLSSSRLSIAEIAFRLGFKSSPHFNQFVRRLTGKKPGDLRKNVI